MRASYSEKDAFVQKIITYPGKANSSGKASSCFLSGRSQFRSHNNLKEFGANCSGYLLYLSKVTSLAAIPGSTPKTCNDQEGLCLYRGIARKYHWPLGRGVAFCRTRPATRTVQLLTGSQSSLREGNSRRLDRAPSLRSNFKHRLRGPTSRDSGKQKPYSPSSIPTVGGSVRPFVALLPTSQSLLRSPNGKVQSQYLPDVLPEPCFKLSAE